MFASYVCFTSLTLLCAVRARSHWEKHLNNSWVHLECNTKRKRYAIKQFMQNTIASATWMPTYCHYKLGLCSSCLNFLSCSRFFFFFLFLSLYLALFFVAILLRIMWRFRSNHEANVCMFTNSTLIANGKYCVCSIKYVCTRAWMQNFAAIVWVHVFFFFSLLTSLLLWCFFCICRCARIGLNGTENIQIIINLQPIFSTCTRFCNCFHT